MASEKRGSNFDKVKALRTAFHPNLKNPMSDAPNFSFVMESKLAGMALPTSTYMMKRLKSEHNVGLVCSLIEASNCPPLSMFEVTEESPEEGPDSLLVEWKDMSIPTRQQMDALLKTTEEYINRGQAVVYHCFGGKGRTGTALACYLLKYHSDTFNGDNVIEHLRELRPNSVETSSQELFVKNYEKYLKGEPLLPENTYSSSSDEEKPKFLTAKLRKVGIPTTASASE